MDTDILNLEWLKRIVELFPETSKIRKNIISIAGYPSWENVNSNLLAFYFDEKEEHNFNRLFLNSLLELCTKKINNDEIFKRIYFDGEFSVEREVVTNSGKRIDLVITERTVNQPNENQEYPKTNWGIIIENKIYASLYNDLTEYWNTINANHKIGIVLSISPISIDPRFKADNIYYINILHKELVDCVLKNLNDYYIDSDDRHLLFLKEYINNINSFYTNNKTTQKMDTILQLFHKNRDEIKKLKKADDELLKYVSKAISEVMNEIGFPSNSVKDSSFAKHFYYKKDNEYVIESLKNNSSIVEKFRFWINIERLKYSNTLTAYFELWGKENTIYGDQLKDNLKNLNFYTNNVQMGSGGKSGNDYQHIITFQIPIGDFSKSDYKTKLKECIITEFFGNKTIDKTIEELKQIIENKA